MLLPPRDTNPLRLREFISLNHEDRTTANYSRWFSKVRPNFYYLLGEIPADEPIAHVAYRRQLLGEESRASTWHYTYFDRHWRRKVYELELGEYFDCADSVCSVKPDLKAFLQQRNISFVSSCKTYNCLTIRDAAFSEVLPGLYYFWARS